MGHDVTYIGKLTPTKELTKEEILIFENLKDHDDYDRLYALEYTGKCFKNNNSCEKIYHDKFFNAIEMYISILKEGGNDIVDGSYLVSCSEYGINEESVMFLYKNGVFERKDLLEIIDEYKDFRIC